MDTQTVLKYVMNSPENTNPNVLKGMLDELSEGGGSSDFSTAKVTVNVEGFSQGMPRYGIVNAPYIDQGDELVEGISLPLQPMDTNPFTVVLYKNSVTWQINAGSGNIPITGVNVTGSAEVSEYSGDYSISITGDCSITVNYGN